jgi:hypothetical protein
MQPCVKAEEIFLEPVAVLLPCHAVDSSSRPARDRQVGIPESFDSDVVKERSELRLPVLPCCFAYTLERTRRAGPALCPGRVLLVRVSLGQALPSTASADVGGPSLFGGFFGTMGLSDFPWPCITGVRPLAFPVRPVAPSAAGSQGISRVLCMKVPHVPGIYDRAESGGASR